MAGSGFWKAILFFAVSKGIVTTAIINPMMPFEYIMLSVSLDESYGVIRINAVIIMKDIYIKVRKVKAGSITDV